MRGCSEALSTFQFLGKVHRMASFSRCCHTLEGVSARNSLGLLEGTQDPGLWCGLCEVLGVIPSAVPGACDGFRGMLASLSCESLGMSPRSDWCVSSQIAR